LIRSGGDVARLVAELSNPSHRDAAIARLRIAGGRAVAPLIAFIRAHESTESRAAALKALEGIDDHRAVDTALDLLGESEPRVTIAAIDVLRTWVTRETGTRIFEALIGLSLDRTREAAIRLAALDAIAELPRALIAPVLEEAGLGLPLVRGTDDPLAAQEWIAGHDGAPLSELHALVVTLGEQERAEASAARRRQWLRARGAAHAALAARGSKVALYDLREAFDAASQPLPLDFLSAMTAVGDATCLEPMARAWAATADDQWWRERLSAAAADIMHRTRLNGRSAVVKRIRARWPGFI
jgi:hypothetical protein